MSIIVHGANASPFVRKVRVVLHEKGIPYTLDPVLPFMPSDDFKKISPLGKIPVLEEDGYTLPDSSCIIAYLEKTHPSPPLYPSDAKDLGRALFYEEYSDSKLTETVGPIFFQRYVQKNLFNKEPDEELVQQKIAELGPLFDWLEAEIGDDQFLVANRFSVADIGVGSVMVNLAHGGERVDPERWPRLAAYVERLHARPSFKTCIEGEAQGVDK